MVAAGMMKMATDDDVPLRQGAGTGSRLVFHGYRGLQWRNFRSRVISGLSVLIGLFGVGLTLRWASRGPLPTRALQRGVARLGASWAAPL